MGQTLVTSVSPSDNNLGVGCNDDMGDFAITHPRQEEVLCKERLQRRLDGYRKHHIIKRNEYDNYTNSEFEKVREDTKILHQKWLEGKAKKGKSKLGKNDSGNLNVGQVFITFS